MKALVVDATWDPRPDYTPTPLERETRRAQVGSNVWRHPRADFRNVSAPQIGPDDVLIRVRRVGFCGSDLHFFETDPAGYIRYPGLTRFPTILGHELAGEVVEVGSRVTHLRVGEPVTIEDMVRCGMCYPCRTGRPNHCENLDEIGFSLDGGFAEFVRAPASNCWSLASLAARVESEAQLYDCGALVEPFTVVYNALVQTAGGVRPGAYTVVHGAGPIGLATVALLRVCGAARIIVFELSERRRTLAVMMGADAVHDPRDAPVNEVVLASTDGLGADLQVEAAGAFQSTLAEMERAVAVGGTILVIGRDSAHVSIYPEPLQVKQGRLVLAQGNAGQGIYPAVLRLIGSGRIDPLPMVTARFPFDDILTALDTSRARAHGKILVEIS